MAEPSDDLIEKIKHLIIQRLKLVEMTPEMIETDAPLFGEGLGLDSIDALELVLGLEKEFGVIIPDAEVGKEGLPVRQDDGPVCLRTTRKGMMDKGKTAFCFPGQLQERPILEDHHPLREDPHFKELMERASTV